MPATRFDEASSISVAFCSDDASFSTVSGSELISTSSVTPVLDRFFRLVCSTMLVILIRDESKPKKAARFWTILSPKNWSTVIGGKEKVTMIRGDTRISMIVFPIIITRRSCRSLSRKLSPFRPFWKSNLYSSPVSSRSNWRLRKQRLTMMTSSNGNISALLALCEGNSPVTGEFPAQRPVTRSFDVFFDLRLSEKCEAGDLRRHRAHYDVTLMLLHCNRNVIILTKLSSQAATEVVKMTTFPFQCIEISHESHGFGSCAFDMC